MGWVMTQEIEYSRLKLALGVVSLIVGLSAGSFALFNWIEQTNLYYLLGNYARYACAFGGFAAVIFGAMLVNDFFSPRTLVGASKIDSDYKQILAWIAEEYSENLRKSSSKIAELNQSDFFLEREEELKVDAQ